MEELPTQREDKRRRMEEEDEIKIIRSKNLELIRDLGSGPGYSLHAGRNRSRAVIVKVFHRGPTGRQQLDSTVALSNELMHPNVLRIGGISSPGSSLHFIVYENGHCKNAEGPLAAALKDDLHRSITLGFKMIAEISAGMNHLCMQGLSLVSMGADNFDILLDVDDRFLMSINPHRSDEIETTESEDAENTWTLFNALCRKTLTAANRVLHNEEINRDPAILDAVSPNSDSEDLAGSLSKFGPGSTPRTKNIQEEKVPSSVPPRREYVWRTLDRGQQSLAMVARRLALDLDLGISRLHRLTQMNGRNAHRCPGYVREEITLATTTLDSAVVAHDTPSPFEICSVCREMVGPHETFWCLCGDFEPGSQNTIKCQACKLWSHSDCVGNPQKEFICQLCWLLPSLNSRSDSNNVKKIGYLALFQMHMQKSDALVEWVYSDQHPFGHSYEAGVDRFADANKQRPVWSVQVLVDGEVYGRGHGHKKKVAKNEAAKQGLIRMDVAV
ncbi:hypothetical protein MVEN_01183400 [Mycena venus]|uniref:DRBM domain-containing protein n=1 Tax=Mycena venus TaxID=2733690 RepID=A0A8H6Y4S3_9AGAR|nr:hypothetical protein MVEN_01183400 [Mycena venus]